MALFLQIIGGIFVVIIGLIAAIFIFFKLKFGKYMNANTDQPPLHIHLNEDISPDWLNKPAAKKVSKELICSAPNCHRTFSQINIARFCLKSA